MINKKLTKLHSLISDLDNTSSNDKNFDSISLISLNLSRTRSTNTQTLPHPPRLSLGQHSESIFERTMPGNLSKKTKSSLQSESPTKPSTKGKQSGEEYLEQLARKIYDARNYQMKIEPTESTWLEFLKTFRMKNTRYGHRIPDAIDLSGVCLSGASMQIANGVLHEYPIIDLSRNIIITEKILGIASSSCLRQLTLKNCGMNNREINSLLALLGDKSVRKLVLSSPDIKDRNTLTKYDELNKFIENSQHLQVLELENIQLSPESNIFNSIRKSKSLTKVDLSKNTAVCGMARNLTSLNLSWNSIRNPQLLKCNQSSLVKLDLTGNPIPSHLFEQFLTTSNYPALECLIISRVNLSGECLWLQSFLEKTRSLRKLYALECSLSKNSYLQIIYGLEANRSLKVLNLSGNKLPGKSVCECFANAIGKSRLSHLYLEQAEIKDEDGSLLFDCLRTSSSLQHVDVSKNGLSSRTSDKICECLKKGCHNLLVLVTSQNFIRYVQLKQIVGYMSRNIHLAKNKIKEEFLKYKNLNENAEINRFQLEQSILQAQQKMSQLVCETAQLEEQYMHKIRRKEALEEQLIRLKLEITCREESFLSEQIATLQEQIRQLNISDSGAGQQC